MSRLSDIAESVRDLVQVRLDGKWGEKEERKAFTLKLEITAMIDAHVLGEDRAKRDVEFWRGRCLELCALRDLLTIERKKPYDDSSPSSSNP